MFTKLIRLASYSLLASILAFFALGGHAFAASVPSTASPPSAASSSAPLNLPALQKSCAVLGIHLNGRQHTTHCLHTHLRMTGSASHGGYRAVFLGRDWNCNYYDTMTIIDTAGEVCFSGYGYLGAALYNVEEADNWTYQVSGGNCVNGWVKAYQPAGHYVTIPCSSVYPDNAVFFHPWAYVTQVDVG